MIRILCRLFQRGTYTTEAEDLARIKQHGHLMEPILSKGLDRTDPWDIGVEGLEATLAHIRYTRRNNFFTPTDDFVKIIRDMLTFCKMTEHLVGFGFGGDYTIPDEVLQDCHSKSQEIKRRDKQILNSLWRTLKCPHGDPYHMLNIVRPLKDSDNPLERVDNDIHDTAVLDLLTSDFYRELEKELGHLRAV